MRKLEETTADWARVPLIDVIGCLELFWERASKEKQTPETAKSIANLRKLVGVSSIDEFTSKSKAIAKLVKPAKSKAVYPYLTFVFASSLKMLKNSDKLFEFVESYTDSLILDLEPYTITDKEIALFRASTIDTELIISQLLYFVNDYKDKLLLEEITGMPIQKLLREIETFELHTSTFARLACVLELDVSFSLIPVDE